MSVSDGIDFKIEKSGHRPFTVLQLTDAQLINGDNKRYPERLGDRQTKLWGAGRAFDHAFSYMREQVEKADADLLVFTGDNVYGEFDDDGTFLEAFIREVSGYGKPWAITFGNHDLETAMGVDAVCKAYETAPHCLFTRGDASLGYGNYTVGVYEDGVLKYLFFFVDSHGQRNDEKRPSFFAPYGFNDAQLKWMESVLKKARGAYGSGFYTVAFTHATPLIVGKKAIQYGYRTTRELGLLGEEARGTFEKLTLPPNADGDFGTIGNEFYDFTDTDFSAHALSKKYGVRGWFFGHEHKNNAVFHIDGITYAYGAKASTYDSHPAGEVGGTRIVLSGEKINVSHHFSALPEIKE